MNETEFLAALARERHRFDRAMAWVARLAFTGPGEHAALVVSAIRTLEASALSGREVDRRCRIVIESVRQDEALLKLIVAGVQGVQPCALNAIRGALPSHLRPLARPRQAPSTQPAAPTIATPQAAGPQAAAPPPLEAEVPSVPTVVLVGTEVEHSANHAMLNRSGFHPIRVATLELLWTVAQTGLCGFVVGPSAWTGLDEQAQHDAVARLCSWSTFTFARISLDGLAEAVARQLPSLLEVGLGRSS